MRKLIILFGIIMALMILCPNNSVFALIMAVTSDGLLYTADTEPARADGIIYAVNENQDYVLERDLTVGAPNIGYYLDYPTPIAIPAGTGINSHLLYYASNTYNAPATTTVTFDADILGIIVTGVHLDNQLGNSDFLRVYDWAGVYDFTNEGRRLEMGSEIDPRTVDPFEIIDSRTITFSMSAHAPWSDQARIITASSPVPEPATLLIFGTGLAGLYTCFRKRIRLVH